MTVIADVHRDHNATFREVGGRRVVADYGRPEREHLAVRNVVGLTEPAYGVVVVEGSDRVGAVADAVRGSVPDEGAGGYVLTVADGAIDGDARVYHAGDRLLAFTPPDRADAVAERIRAAGRDATVRVATDEFAVLGLHGPKATEKVASVLHGATVPDERMTFVRGRLDDVGVTVVKTDAPAGEEGFEVVCAAEGGHGAYDVLLNQGLNAAPFGYRAWETLTLEAGTPLFDPDLRGLSPAAVGFEGGAPDRRLVGLALDGSVPAGSEVVVDGDPVGRITRAVESPVLEEPIAFAAVAADADPASPTVRTDEGEVAAERRALPFVAGSDRSGRIP